MYLHITHAEKSVKYVMRAEEVSNFAHNGHTQFFSLKIIGQKISPHDECIEF